MGRLPVLAAAAFPALGAVALVAALRLAGADADGRRSDSVRAPAPDPSPPGSRRSAEPPPPIVDGPRYMDAGALLLPQGYDRWVFLGASLGLGYSEGTRGGPGDFHDVRIHPEAYDAYLETGRFPEGTMLVLTIREAASRVPPAREGLFEGDLLAVEMAVKDAARFIEGWAYFGFGGVDGSPASSARAFPKEACFACHSVHAAEDNVFVQFYPVLTEDAARRLSSRVPALP